MFRIPKIKNIIKNNTKLALSIFNKGVYIKATDNIYDAEKLMNDEDLIIIPISNYCKKDKINKMIGYMTKHDVEVQVRLQEWNDYEDRKCRDDMNPYRG
jgi:hypothetical protein